MQTQHMQNKIMGLWFQCQRFIVSDDRGVRETRRPAIRKTGHDRDGCKGSVNLVQSLLQLISRKFLQEQGVWLCAQAIAGQCCAVGDLGHIHAGHLGCKHALAKRHSGHLSAAVHLM